LRAYFLRRTGAARRLVRAFTLVELLLVIVIVGVLAAMVVPQFSAGIGGTRLQVEARAIAQAERYARTMALLHQAEVALTISTNGVLRVAAAGAEAVVERSPEEGLFPAAPAAGPTPDGVSVALLPGGDGEAPVVRPAGEVTATAFAEAIRIERVIERVTVRFLGYTDSAPEQAGAAAEAVPDDDRTARIVFRSNGTCRPHRFRLEDASGAALEVAVDILGTARIDER
jgi:prepilin-type N-terminal cleavage/methylation domain-containing protein